MVWILDACALINEVIQFQILFCFANLWVLINALEGLYKHIRIDICSFKLSIYLFTFVNLKEHCLIQLYLILF